MCLLNNTGSNSVLNDCFDWEEFEEDWNWKVLKPNKKIKTKNGDVVYCHSDYAQDLYNSYYKNENINFDNDSKDLYEGKVIKISGCSLLGKDELLVSTSSGNCAIINLAKENKFFELYGMTKQEFKEKILNTPEGRQWFVNENHLAKIQKNGNASLYDGMMVKIEQEFMEQIALGDNANKAYKAHIESSNKGGYIVTVCGMRAFLPGSQASTNKITDFESLIGTDLEVMIMKYIEGTGFLVSRKKYLRAIMPAKMNELRQLWETDKDKVWTGTVTGIGKDSDSPQPFGVFIELNEYYTGLMHKLYISDSLLEKVNSGDIKPDDKINVYIHDITENNRIVLSDMPTEERMKVVEVREKAKEEENKEKAKQTAEANSKKTISYLKKQAGDNFNEKSGTIKLQ